MQSIDAFRMSIAIGTGNQYDRCGASEFVALVAKPSQLTVRRSG